MTGGCAGACVAFACRLCVVVVGGGCDVLLLFVVQSLPLFVKEYSIVPGTIGWSIFRLCSWNQIKVHTVS